MAQLRQRQKDFAAAGATVACVIAMDPVRAAYFAKNKPGPYTALSDVSSRVASLYGVAKQLVVHDEWVNAPSVFVIRGGKVAWSYVGKSWGDRPTMDTILDEVAKASK